ncbi:MAG: 50S ribosomal protein L30 [Candidatus Obscuribacterales bacterium]|nr:50S ribosomal protein L30 [Candidatus Obscuribacterales bacterium]
MLKITLSRGMTATTETQRRTIKGLGLGKFGSCAFHADSPTIRGMINKVNHLITVEKEERATKEEKPAKKETKAASKK